MAPNLFVTLGVLLLVLSTFAVTVRSSLHTVREGTIEILFVFGEVEAILEPGLNLVPPFVSSSYPIDLRTMQYETPEGSKPIPPNYHDEVEDAAAGHMIAE